MNNPHHTTYTALLAQHQRHKTNIARFGATWLRPAGVPKTLQASEDEAAEKLEQEEQERRQRNVAEMQAAMEREEARARLEAREARARATGGDAAGDLEPEAMDQIARDVAAQFPRSRLGDAIEMDGEDIGMGMERDLDADVLEQENAAMSDEEDSEEDDEEEEEEGESEVEFEDEPQHAERDLDDDVPEASGEYEHTDTNIEDTSGISVAPPGSGFAASGGRAPAATTAGWMTSSPGVPHHDESSVFGGHGYGDGSPGMMAPPRAPRR